MIETIEYQIRAVERYVLTCYREEKSDSEENPRRVNASCITLGEYPSASQAEAARAAFETAEKAKARMGQYAIVQRGFDPATQVYYADTRDQAESFAEQFQKLHGGEWRIYAPA